ncbi:hypothetical protein FisN_17Lh075 [Fistulifera solaris]|uniref:C3H1-type domain-containing protein n=1 Tax=Fistulifera solaris TaxID=1519565 RepID=A0A1Z5K1F2_FISSO|nr:hypothetical protein FisN_17Lh075 [Fistulifera solaris]|eukprot:GAX20123.1 hypothetical protein FisN_17Lh075 [Fistulifera solaris]
MSFAPRGSGRYSDNNYRGGGGGGDNNYRGGGSNYRGGGRSSSRGGRHSSRGSGGRGRSSGRFPPNTPGKVSQTALFWPCLHFTQTGNCRDGDNCTFSHVVQLFGNVDAAGAPLKPQPKQPSGQFTDNTNTKGSVSSIAIWEDQGIKIFTGGSDGFWRLWNTAGGQFQQSFESNMNGKVNCLAVVNNFLFCGFEAVTRAFPMASTGLVHAWNLQSPNNPPVEFQLHPNLVPYAHNTAVSCLAVDPTTMQVVSGSQDGAIRVWKLDTANNTFGVSQRLDGHARQITGLVPLPQQDLLWSSGIDGCIRIWKLSTGECQFSITAGGHTHAVTGLQLFQSTAGSFILSCSLDSTIKAWNASTGECVMSESHDEGITCMTIGANQQGQPLLLIGLESGIIQCRNLVQTPKVNAFALLWTLDANFSVSHGAAVRSVTSGPSGTFYTGGDDGKMLVWQIGDMKLT